MHDLPPPKPYYQFIKKKPFASIIKFPPDKGQKEIAYKDLVCTEKDKAKIYEIVTTVSRHTKLSLWPKSGHLNELGAQIGHVHPLKFLGTIFSHPELKACMPDIIDDYFKRSKFMAGLGTNLTKEADKGKLMPYLQDFSTEVGHHPHNTPIIQSHFESREWESLVRFLMNN